MHASHVGLSRPIKCCAETTLHSSEQVSLLHDAQELLLIHFAIPIPISLVYHLLQFFVRHTFAKFFCHPFQVLERYLSGLVVIEQAECLQNFILWVPVQYLMCHHLQELFVFDSTTSVVINVRNHLLNLLLLWFKTQRTHGNFKLLGIDGARPIGVEVIEGFLDFLLLLLSKLLLLFAAGIETAERHTSTQRRQ